MSKFGDLVFEELPIKQKQMVKGGACKCADYCSCYSTEKQSHIDNATDTANDVNPDPFPN